MASPDPADFTLLGMGVKDLFTLIIVPIIATLTTLFVQDRQQRRERRMQLLRTLTATRAWPADAGYVGAINLIPIEFNGVNAVTTAWSNYIQHVSSQCPPGGETRHAERSSTLQTKLISAMMKNLNLKVSEADLQADAYVSTGFAQRDRLYIDSLIAQRDIANALKAQGSGEFQA